MHRVASIPSISGIGELGYARMSLESVAAAGTTMPSVRRRFSSKAALAEAVISSLRVAELPAQAGPPRARALAILENFRRNLLREDAMAVLGTLLADQRRHPELLEIFRTRLAGPRRGLLRQALMDSVTAGELPSSADPDVLTSMLDAKIRPVPVTWDDRRGTAVRHDGQPCPSACST